MKRTERAAALSTAVYALLGGGMMAVALVSGSVSLLAESIHTLTDSVTSMAVLIGLRLSERHSKTFPFGLYKLENLITAAIGVLILFGAYELASETIRQLAREPVALEHPALVLITMAASMPLIGLVAWYENKVAREEMSPGLGADARHSLVDLGAAAAVFVGVGLEAVGAPRADSMAALVVVVFLAWAGFEVALNGVKVLLDASISQDVLSRVKEIAESNLGVKKVLRVEGRNSGSYRFLSLIIVPRSRELKKANQVAEEIALSVKGEIEKVDRVIVIPRVEKRDSILSAVPLDRSESMISTHFGEAYAFALINVKLPEGRIDSREILLNPFTDLPKGKGVRVAEFLAQQGVELLLVGEPLEGRGAHYALEAQGVIVLPKPGIKSLEEAERALAEDAPGSEAKHLA